MVQFTGDAGNIYIEEDDDGYDVWFEDFCILGSGKTETEALQDALRQTVDLNQLVGKAIQEVRNASST